MRPVFTVSSLHRVYDIAIQSELPYSEGAQGIETPTKPLPIRSLRKFSSRGRCRPASRRSRRRHAADREPIAEMPSGRGMIWWRFLDFVRVEPVNSPKMALELELD